MQFSLQKRGTVRTQDYSYHPISNTPFTLGIALPRDYGRYRVKGEIEVSLAKFNSKIFWKIKIGSTESSSWNFFQFLICSLETPGDCIRIGCIANTITPVHLFANSRIRKTTWNTFLLRCNNRIGIGVLQVYCLCQSVVEHKDSIQTASSVSRYFEYCVYCTNVECVLD